MDLGLPEKFYKRAKLLEKPWEKYDLMKDYRYVLLLIYHYISVPTWLIYDLASKVTFALWQ